jgi:hypothetical protein
MMRSGPGKHLLLPLVDAIVLGSIIGAYLVFRQLWGNSLDPSDAKILLAFATTVALAVFVVEIILHLIPWALARRSGSRGRLDVAPVAQATRGQWIRRLLLLPLLDAIVLGLIVGVLLISIHIDHNPMDVIHDFDTGGIDFAHLTRMFAVFSVPMAIIVLVVELIVHGLAAALQRGRLRRAKS